MKSKTLGPVTAAAAASVLLLTIYVQKSGASSDAPTPDPTSPQVTRSSDSAEGSEQYIAEVASNLQLDGPEVAAPSNPDMQPEDEGSRARSSVEKTHETRLVELRSEADMLDRKLVEMAPLVANFVKDSERPLLSVYEQRTHSFELMPVAGSSPREYIRVLRSDFPDYFAALERRDEVLRLMEVYK